MACLDQVIAAVGHCQRTGVDLARRQHDARKLGTTYRSAAQGCSHRMRKPGAKRLDAGVLRTTLLGCVEIRGDGGRLWQILE
jgi:hypothetical protein